MKRFLVLLVILDAFAAVSALVAGYWLRFGSLVGMEEIFEVGGIRLVVFVLVVIGAFYFCELYSRELLPEKLEIAARISVALMVAFFILSAVYFIIPQVMIGRGYIALSLLIAGAAQFVFHELYRQLLTLPRFSKRVLIFGVGPLAEKIRGAMSLCSNNYGFAGYARPDQDVVTVSEEEILGDAPQLEALVRAHRIQKLIVAVTERRGVLPVGPLLRCKLGGVDVMDAPTFYEQVCGKLLVENIQPSWFIYSDGFCVTPFLRFQKRFLDLIFSLTGLLLSFPLWPVVALLVRLDSPGPVFFKQPRVGENNRLFNVLKFRTMRNDAEKDTGAVWAVKNDPRVTRVGNFLRKSRLDEIPQLLNVLKGDMSFIGPRPERPEFVNQLEQKIPYFSKRHFMKPGVTGWAQVCYPYGASDEDALEKLRYDLYYIKNYSLWLDFLIVLETVKVVLFWKGGR